MKPTNPDLTLQTFLLPRFVRFARLRLFLVHSELISVSASAEVISPFKYSIAASDCFPLRCTDGSGVLNAYSTKLFKYPTCITHCESFESIYCSKLTKEIFGETVFYIAIFVNNAVHVSFFVVRIGKD